MRIIFRLLLALIVFASAYLFIYWVPFSLIPGAREPAWLPTVVSLCMAMILGWFVWSRSKSVPTGLASLVFYSATAVGAVGFAAGFFGPILFAPGANQGPLLGILVTGPLGGLLGAVGGFIYWLGRRRKSGGAVQSDV